MEPIENIGPASSFDERTSIANLKAGCHREFTRLYRQRQQWVAKAVGARLDGHPSDWNDACQEVWLHAFEKISSLRASSWGEAHAWILKLAMRVAENYRERVIERCNSRFVFADVEGFAVTAESALQWKKLPSDRDELENVRSAAKHLPAHARTIIIMILDGCDYHTVAKRLGMSEAAVRKQVSLAKPELKRHLGVAEPRKETKTSSKRRIKLATKKPRSTRKWLSTPAHPGENAREPVAVAEELPVYRMYYSKAPEDDNVPF